MRLLVFGAKRLLRLMLKDSFACVKGSCLVFQIQKRFRGPGYSPFVLGQSGRSVWPWPKSHRIRVPKVLVLVRARGEGSKRGPEAAPRKQALGGSLRVGR